MVTHARDHERLVKVEGIGFSSDRDFNQLVSESHDVARVRMGDTVSNPYALGADTLQFLCELLNRIGPRQIVEFGSGESTRLFAEWAVTSNARLISFEHDGYWASQVRSGLHDRQLQIANIVHAPLVLKRHGLRLFLTYQGLHRWTEELQKSSLILIDGPHMAGREPVLYFAMNHCRVGAVIVVDDFNLYGIRDVLTTVPPELVASFEGTAIETNSHGLYVLRCRRSHEPVMIPFVGVKAAMRSYWRCLRDYRTYGTGRT